MTREDIIRMANESADQAPRVDWNTNAWVFGEEMLEYFANLVAAAERKACANLVEADGLARGDEGLVLIKAAGRIRAMGE